MKLKIYLLKLQVFNNKYIIIALLFVEDENTEEA